MGEQKLRVGYMGSGRFAARCLELIAPLLRPEWVLTSSPGRAGRGLKLQNTPVFELAESLSIPVYTTERLFADKDRIEWVRAKNPDVILVIDFGHMIKEPLLSATRFGCLNIHPSKLPAYRGSSPVQRALMDGLAETAVSIFRLDEGMDSGDILAQPVIKIDLEDDAASLMEKAAVKGTEVLLKYLTEFPAGEWRFTPQSEEGISAAPKIEKIEGKIEWNSSSDEIVNKIRGIGAAPGVYCSVRGKRVRIHRAQTLALNNGAPGTLVLHDGIPVVLCKEGSLKLIEVQPEGKKSQKAEEWVRGARISEGEKIQ